MASVISEILSSAGKMEKEDISKNVDKLVKSVDEIKIKINDVIEPQYKDFTPFMKHTENLVEEVNNMKNEIKSLSGKIDNEVKGQLTMAVNEYHDLKKQLEESNKCMELISKLMFVHDNLENIENSLHKSDYFGASKSLANVEIKLKELSCYCDNIPIILCIRTEYHVKREKLIYDLCDIWKKHFEWHLPINLKDSNKEENIEYKLMLKEKKNMNEVKSLINAMHQLGHLRVKMKAFGIEILKYFVVPILKSDVRIVQNDHPHSVSITLKKEKSVTDSEEKPDPCNVIDNIMLLFKLMNDLFLCLKVENLDDLDTENLSLMAIMGDLVVDQFCDLIIQRCLAESIPASSKCLEKYIPVDERCRKLQELLIELKFLKPENEVMSSYTQNVNVLFVNKMCKDILGRAREIMKKELFETVVVDKNHMEDKSEIFSKKDGLLLKDKSMKSAQEAENEIMPIFNFPVCKISKSTLELLELVKEVLNEASISSAVCASRLFYTSRNIFELYCSMMSTYHGNNFSELPHLCAIQHDNCMFLAHQLQTLGHRYQQSLPQSIASGHITYVDLIPRIRKMGNDIFINQMTKQKIILFECLKEAQGFQNIAMDESFSPHAEKAIKQCFHHLESLQRVWLDVLPSNVYDKTIGTLVNSWIENILISVISQEDISADNAFQLKLVFGSISEKTPLLFKRSDSADYKFKIYKYVKLWPKFLELMIVLEASMQELVDRWSVGKGPLAESFNADEVKQLIRALFQNTERRAAVLAKIK